MQKFYPAPEEIFTIGGRDVLIKHKAAHCANLKNIRTLRDWFAGTDHDEELYEYMAADYKIQTDVKEKCRAYMRRRMTELVPLPFTCSTTGAVHHIPWPESWLWHRVLLRKHEWRKGQKEKKENGNFSCTVRV